MKYYWKVFKWENGAKAEELTNYLIVPVFLEPHLDEILGTGEIILECVPKTKDLNLRPKTKIRIERYLTANFSDTPTKYDYVVDSDEIQEYIGTPCCCHLILFDCVKHIIYLLSLVHNFV